MYLVGFLMFLVARQLARAKTLSERGFTAQSLDDLLFYGVLGVILGGRLGYVLFYKPGYYSANPADIIRRLERRHEFSWRLSRRAGGDGAVRAQARQKFPGEVTDFIAPLVPLGLLAGRVSATSSTANCGGGLPTLRCHGPWCSRNGDNLPRHPSQLYQAGMEGLLLFIILWWYSSRPRPRRAISGVFLIGYGVFRWVGEYFREPDAGIFGHSYLVSMGQWLSLPMVLAGIALLFLAQL